MPNRLREPIDRATLFYAGLLGGQAGAGLQSEALTLPVEELPTSGDVAADAVLPNGGLGADVVRGLGNAYTDPLTMLLIPPTLRMLQMRVRPVMKLKPFEVWPYGTKINPAKAQAGVMRRSVRRGYRIRKPE